MSNQMFFYVQLRPEAVLFDKEFHCGRLELLLFPRPNILCHSSVEIITFRADVWQAVLQVSHFIQAGKWHTLYSTIYLLLTPCLGVLFVYDSFALC